MKMLFIRHGDPDYEHDSLTEVGFREAELLARRIAPMPIDEFFVSPLGRALETAKPTLAKAGRTAETFDWLQEFSIPVRRPDRNGELSRIPWDWLPQDWLQDPMLLDPIRWRENPVLAEAKVGEAYDAVIEHFDCLLEARGYRRDGLLYRCSEGNTRCLAFFCHLGISCLLLSHLLNCSPMVLWHGTCLAPTSVTTVYTEERRPGVAAFRIQSLGDISHLYAGGQNASFAARFCEVYGNGDRVD